jgi:competence protein ComEC
MGHLAKFEVMAHALIVEGHQLKIREKVWVTIFKNPPNLSPGTKIRFPARLRSFQNFNNPGRYNYELAMHLRGLSCAASISDGRYVVFMGRGELGFPGGFLETIRRPIRTFFMEKLSIMNGDLLRAMILGEKQNIPPQLRESISIAGLGHILAVSGLHIGLVSWLVFVLSKGILSLSYRLTLKRDIRRIAAVITCVPVVFYTAMTGFQVSSQRAMVMVLTYLVSIILRRDKEVWSTLALAALIILCLDPHALFSLSFQLSFGALIGILWLAPPLHQVFLKPWPEETGSESLGYRFYTYVAGLISVTLSAMMFLIPIISFYFHRISLVSLPANLMAVPILGLWILPWGLLSAIILPFSLPVANTALLITECGLECFMAIVDFWSAIPWASIWVITPSLFEMVIFYGLLLFVFFTLKDRSRTWAKMGLLIFISLMLFDMGCWVYETSLNNRLRVTYMDVGNGNAAIIQFPGNKRMLIDGGGFSSDHFDVGRMVVATTLWKLKLKRVDYLVLTHPQSDHMNGLRFIAKHFQPEEFWFNGQRVETPSFKELMNIIQQKGIKVFRPGDLVGEKTISGVKIEVLHPQDDAQGGKRPYSSAMLNNQSLVLKLSYGETALLFPGDLEKEGEEAVVANAGRRLKSDILLAPHHGSRTSCSVPFLKKVMPKVCIISSRSDSYLGFPHPETLETLQDTGCRILRIDQVGSVSLSIGPDGLRINTFLSHP